MNSNLNADENRTCEWLSQFLFPNLTNTIKTKGYESLFDFLYELNKNKSMQVLKEFSNTEKYETLDHSASSLNKNGDYLVGSMSDLFIYLKICNQFESNFVYVIWLLNLFKPLITTLFITLFLLPSVIVIPLYGSLLFLFLTKHWNKVIVSTSFYFFLAHGFILLNFINQITTFQLLIATKKLIFLNKNLRQILTHMTFCKLHIRA